MADRSGTAAESEVATESGAALTPMGQFLGRPDLPLNRSVTTIGSRETCRLQLDSRSISRVHALVVSTDQGAYVADLCSRTGVLVNGRSIRDSNLVGGDRIQLGRFTFRFRGSRSAVTASTGTAPVMPLAPPLALKDGDALTTVSGRALLIGRRENADLPLSDDLEVSTVHAVLFQLDGDWHVRDLASRTGTRVNGTPIETQQRVEMGDTLEIGSAVLTLVPAPPRAESAEGDDAALPLGIDAPPLADLEPLDFSSIDSIEAGDTDDDTVPTLPPEQSAPLPQAEYEPTPAGVTIPSGENAIDSDDLRDSGESDLIDLSTLELAPDPAQAAAVGGTEALDWDGAAPVRTEPAESIAESSEPTLQLPLEVQASVVSSEEPTRADEPLAAESAEPSSEAEGLVQLDPAGAAASAETLQEPLEVAGEPLTELPEPVTELPEAQPKRKRARRPAAPKRERPLRKAPGVEVEGMAAAGAALNADAALQAAPSASLPELLETTDRLDAPASTMNAPADVLGATEQTTEVSVQGQPLEQPEVAAAADELPSLQAADVPDAAPLDTPVETAPAALENRTALDLEPSPSLDPVADTDPISRPIAEVPADAGRLELSALSDDEEFVAVPEPEELEPPAAVTDFVLAAEPPASQADEPEMDLSFEPLPDQTDAGPVEAVSLPVEPSTANDWLLDEGPAELPLTTANTAAVEPVTEPDRKPTSEPVSAEAVGLTAAVVTAGVLLGESAATTATAAGPGVFGFTFEGGSFLGGAHLLDETPQHADPAAPSAVQMRSAEADASEMPAAERELAPGSEPEPEPEPLLLDDEPADSASLPVVDEPPTPSGAPASIAEQPTTRPPQPAPVTTTPTPIETLSDEITVPPLATPARTLPRQRRPLTTDFDGLSTGAKITGFVGGVSVNGRSPAGRGGPSVDVFSQLSPAIGADALAEAGFAAGQAVGPAVGRRSPPPSMPPGVATIVESPVSPSPVAEKPSPPASREVAAALPASKVKRRWPLWGLLGLMFLSLGAVWAAVYGLVPLSSRVTGTLSFANLSQQSESAQSAFKADQLARLHSNEVRTIARSILQNGGAPTGFTEDMISLGRALDRDGNAGFTGDTLSVVVRANDPTEGRAQVDALLVALAQRDADLGDTQHRSAQDLIDANAAVATARDHLDSLKGELPAVRARGEDRPDAEEVAALQASSDRAERLVTLARSTRLNAEAELDLLRMPLPKPPSPSEAAANGATGNAPGTEDSPRDAQLTRLRWELQDLGRQVNDLKLSRPDTAGAAPVAPPPVASGDASAPAAEGPRGDAVNDSLLAYLDTQVQALSAALSDQATGVPGPAGESVRLRQMESLSVRVHSLEQAEKTAHDNAQLAIDKLRSLQGRLDSARQATVEIDQLIADIRTAETTLRDKSDAAAAAQQLASFAVSVAGDPSESVQPLSDHRPVYAGVLSGLVLCVFSGLTINALRHEPAPTAVETLTGEDPDHVIGRGGFDMAAEPTPEEEPVGVGDLDRNL